MIQEANLHEPRTPRDPRANTTLPSRRQLPLLALLSLLVACGSDPAPGADAGPVIGGGAGATAPAAGSSGALGAAGAGATSPAAGGGGGRAPSGGPTAGTTAPTGAAGDAATAAGMSGGEAGAPAAGSSAEPGEPMAGGEAQPQAGGAAPAQPSGPYTIVPHGSWDCGLPEGIPDPTNGEPAFEATLQLQEVLDVGQTPLGKRQVTHSNGGPITGSRLSGEFLEGGLGYDLELSNGVREVEEVHILRSREGTPLYLRGCGVALGPGTTRMVAHFEAPNSSSYAFLNETKLVGTRELDTAAKTLKFAFYEVMGGGTDEKVTVEEPADVTEQWSWECKTGPTGRGPTIIEEDVLIGGSISVGATTGGSRNIIPITGGTFTGDRGMGDIIPGGADFQMSGGGGFVLDARYTLRASDGSYVIVRNCGGTGALIPVLETSITGSQAWVNGFEFVSTVSVGVGRVYITIFEAN